MRINYHTVFFHALYRQYSSTAGWLSSCDDLFTNSEGKLQMISFIDSYDLFIEIFAVQELYLLKITILFNHRKIIDCILIISSHTIHRTITSTNIIINIINKDK